MQTNLSITEVAAVIAAATGDRVKRYENKEKAVGKLKAALTPVTGEAGADKAAAAILSSASGAHALDVLASIKAEADRDARVMKAAAETVSPGLARLRAHPKAEQLRQEAVAVTEAAARGEDVLAKPRRDRKALLALAEAAAPAKVEKPKKAAKPKAEKAPKAEGVTARVKTEVEAKITAVVANPKKEGSRAFKVFSLYQAGMTVAAFIEACAKEGIGAAEAKSNISWDRRKGFIRVYP